MQEVIRNKIEMGRMKATKYVNGNAGTGMSGRHGTSRLTSSMLSS